jgi:hypothetical protein
MSGKQEEQRVDKVNTDIAIIDERTIRDRIYVVRGVKVMLDFDLAEIYGYETKNFNRQVKNNADRFEGDEFMFQLTREEVEDLMRCKNFTSRIGNLFKGQSGGSRYLPNVFTEQGVYLLMTVLRGELAVRQSRALVMAFKTMKDYIVETQGLVWQRELLRLSMQTTENVQEIRKVHEILDSQGKELTDLQIRLVEHDDILADALVRMNNTVQKSELAPFLKQFEVPEYAKEYLIREGHPVRADVTYMDIYSRAKNSVYIIDNYINIKTLHLLQDVKPGVSVTVFSDNLQNKLHLSDVSDFSTEFPSIPVSFITTGGIMHDRFIVLDYGKNGERMFHCGASSKDAAVKLTTAISELTSEDIIRHMHVLIDQMKGNPVLVLK